MITEGAGRSAIYVYALLKADGSSSWKISGGLNGGNFTPSGCGKSRSLCNDTASYATWVVSVIATVATSSENLAILSKILAGITALIGAAISICILGGVVMKAIDKAECDEALKCILDFALAALISICVSSIVGLFFGPVGAFASFLFGMIIAGATQSVISSFCVNDLVCKSYD